MKQSTLERMQRESKERHPPPKERKPYTKREKLPEICKTTAEPKKRTEINWDEFNKFMNSQL